jgi:hypothetical protein
MECNNTVFKEILLKETFTSLTWAQYMSDGGNWIRSTGLCGGYWNIIWTHPFFTFTTPVNRFTPFPVFCTCHTYSLRFCLLSGGKNIIQEMSFCESFSWQYSWWRAMYRKCAFPWGLVLVKALIVKYLTFFIWEWPIHDHCIMYCHIE